MGGTEYGEERESGERCAWDEWGQQIDQIGRQYWRKGPSTSSSTPPVFQKQTQVPMNHFQDGLGTHWEME